MSERNELPQRDRKLLEKIEEIVANGDGERRETDSLYGFCAHLASTVPQADQSFQQQLEARLLTEMQQQREVRTLGVTSQDQGAARPPLAWLRRLAPGGVTSAPLSTGLSLSKGVGRNITQIFQGGVTMKKGFAFATLAALVIVVSVVAFVPAVRAGVSGWFRASWGGPDAGCSAAIRAEGSQPGFTVLVPSYLPDTVLSSATGSVTIAMGGDADEMRNFFGNPDGQWLFITQGQAPADKALPEGQQVAIGGQRGVLITSLSGTSELGLADLENVAVEGTPPEHRPESFAYQNANQLIWYVGDTRIELLSNLPVEEMLKVAESFRPAEVTEGEPPADWVPEQSEGGSSGGGVLPLPTSGK
ncbi:MAG: hypothetical protein CVU38_11470 [Chloroflexi bacterium HGW-Chloroflexi-1]|nr:MAG: hypothetical protein CVU38_11470 [Chloroflexi bacterium HGW-Chloroflexi-1]